jgi:uncharacterized membrane protein
MDTLLSLVQGGVAVAGGTTMDKVNAIVLQVLRWGHFFFGIAWIGHLYYFNFVQAHAEKALDGPMKKIVVPNFRGRAIWWFRWGAMITFLTGLAYLFYEQFVATSQGFGDGWFKAPANQWILFGMLLGTIMWFNVWFVIWPRQKQIIAGVATGNKPADFDALVATAGKFSRINTYLSVPMLFGMGARKHFAEIGFNSMWTGITMLLVFVVGVAIAYHVVNQAASKAGTEFAAMLPPPAPAAPPAPPPAAK